MEMLISHWFYKVISKCPLGALESVGRPGLVECLLFSLDPSGPLRAMAEITNIFKCPLRGTWKHPFPIGFIRYFFKCPFGALENVDFYKGFPQIPRTPLQAFDQVYYKTPDVPKTAQKIAGALRAPIPAHNMKWAGPAHFCI